MGPHIQSLTGLRFIAAFSILIAHGLACVIFSDARWLLGLSTGFAYFGMSLFFVLSGFVLYLNYAPSLEGNRPGALKDFFVARFARLYPLYFFYMAVCFATIVYTRIPDMFPDILYYIPLVQSWIAGTKLKPVLFTLDEAAATWSVSTEFFFYLLFPILCSLAFRYLKRVNPFIEIVALTVLSLAVLYMIYSLWPWLISYFAGSMPDGVALQWLNYYSPFCRIFEFMTGLSVARLYLYYRDRKPTSSETTIAGIIALLCALTVMRDIYYTALPPTAPYDFWSFIRPNFWNAPPIAYLIIYSARYESSFSKLMSSPSLVLGGEISYSMYFFHIFLVNRFLGGEREIGILSAIEWIVRFSVFTTLVLCLSYGTYSLVEKPCRNGVRKFLSRTRAIRRADDSYRINYSN